MDRAMLLDHLAQAERLVAQGEEHRTKLRAIIDRLESHGLDSTPAKQVLDNFEDLQAMHVADRDRLLRELARLSGS